MRFSTVTLSLATAALCKAQSLSSLPNCASSGVPAAITATGCQSTDIACICKADGFISSLTQYAEENCSADDYTSALQIGQAACLQAGVTITIPSASASASASASGPASTYIAAAVADNDAAPTTNSSGMTMTMATATATATGAAAAATGAAGTQAKSVTVITTSRCSCEQIVITSTLSDASTPIATFTGGAVPAAVAGFGLGETAWKDGLMAAIVGGLLGVLGLW